MVRIDDSNRHSCVGCGSCMQACPNKCIEMAEDAEGFLYPSVDEAKCTKCGLCDGICPVGHDLSYDPHFDEPEAVAGYHKDGDVLEASSSGGAFTLFAKSIISSGGVVCGCVLDDNLKAVHAFTDDAEGLLEFRYEIAKAPAESRPYQ